MANNLFVGANVAIPKVAADGVSFATAGFNSTNCFTIFKVSNPLQSWEPGRDFNQITEFELGTFGYWIVMKVAGDFTTLLSPPIGDDGTPAVPGRYQFNGTSQKISLANPNGLLFAYAQPFSIAFYAKILNTGANSISLNATTSTNARIYDLDMYHDSGSLILDYQLTDIDTSKFKYKTATGAFFANQFEYFTFTWDGTNSRVYVNGVLITTEDTNTGTMSALVNSGSNKVEIAGAGGAVIDDLSFWNIALSTDQQADLLTNPNPAGQTFGGNALAYFSFSHNLEDSVGNHDGTATSPVYI